MKNYLIKGNVVKLAEILSKSWVAKQKVSESVTNSNIDKIYNYAKEKGAMAGKVSGAGGGGFMFFLVKPEKKRGTKEICNLGMIMLKSSDDYSQTVDELIGRVNYNPKKEVHDTSVLESYATGKKI